ncbi:MAG TPA: glycosyltransferase, partial [Cytophagaceae bacterium]|nr:glycosyltransferase [Cytophagaceae bacterium]
SVEKILAINQKYPFMKYILNEHNIGMCRSFNKALAIAKGEYIIDLAADDAMLPERVEEQVNAFLKLSELYGVVYSDAYIISENGDRKHTFYKRTTLGELSEGVLKGDVFKELIHSYKICSPTIMVRKKLLEEMGGYDEILSYEDYDFFVRSSREYRYYYIDKPLTLKREVKGSDSSSWYRKGINVHLESTLIVCKKALWLCRNDVEKKSLLHSVRYHFRQSYFVNNYALAGSYYDLILCIVKKSTFLDKTIMFLARNKVSVYGAYMKYIKLRSAVKTS